MSKKVKNPNEHLSDSIIGFGFMIGVALVLFSLVLAAACFDYTSGVTPAMFGICLIGGYVIFLVFAFISMMVYSSSIDIPKTLESKAIVRR